MWPGSEQQFESKNIFLFNSNFTPLAGCLGIGYFIHPVSIPIVRNNKDQQHNERDVTYGYALVLISYLIIGTTGYFGFMGSVFQGRQQNDPIAQNCITMFSRTNVVAFFMRQIMFSLVFSSFPIINHFFRSGIFKLLYTDLNDSRISNSTEVSDLVFKRTTISVVFIPFVITILYPEVATILGIVGSVLGFLIVYVLPVFTYL